MTCPSCGSEVPAGARFCPHCGHQVDTRGDQRRVVTVLFADLAGFTTLSETLDPESVKNVVDRCFAALAADVTGHGGRVDKVIGDAIVALFGAPRAHEDDAERAVRTGLQMQLTIDRLAREVGLPLQLRVGINTGEVLVGALRAGGDYTAMGDVVNVASRLQTSARPGTVVVGAATHAATTGLVRYHALGQVRARGREEPVEAWQAVESLVPPGHRPPRRSSPLIGREDELGMLRHAVGSSISHGRAALVVIVGDAGIGKSRLSGELADWASGEHDALVLDGRCVPYGEANPWWPVAEAVRQACGIDGSDPADVAAGKCRDAAAGATELPATDPRVEHVTAGLMHLMGDQDALPDVDPQRARQQGRKALHTLITGLARRQPVMLVLSEMHWADDLVLELVGAHLDRLARLPVTLVVTGRPELLDRWEPPRGRHNLLVAHLDPLDAESSRALVNALLEGASPPGLADALAERSGGNPFFLEELVSLIASGTDELPVTLRGIVAARVDQLPADERAMLEDAAVVGRSGLVFTLRALAAKRDAADVEQALDQLVERELLLVDDGRWQFRSDVVREVVYEILTKSERARRHWQLATWITEQVRRMGREDEYLEQVAHHHATAAELVAEIGPCPGVPESAASVAVAALAHAASWALGRELLTAADRLLDRALPLIPTDDVETRRNVLLDRALVRATLRELAAARSDLEEAEPGAEGAARARYLTILGFVQQTAGEPDASMATLSEAVDAWRRLGDREGEGDALRRAGMTSLFSGDLSRAEKLLSEALSIARSLERRRDEAWALWHLAWAAFASGQAELAEQRLRDASDAFRAAGDAGGEGWVRGLLGYICMTQGRRGEAERLALSVLDDARDRGDRWALGMLLVLLGILRLWQGAAGSAAEFAREAKQTFAAMQDTAGMLRALGLLARALAATGQLDEARRMADEALALGAHGPVLGIEPLADRLVPLAVALDSGDWRTAEGIVADLPPGPVMAEVTALRGLTELQAGRFEEGRATLEQAAASEGPEGAVPNIWALLALGRAAAGDPDGALAAAERSLGARPAGTYRDEVTAFLARALAGARLGRSGEAETALAEAEARVGSTTDRLLGTVVGLAAASVRGDGAASAAALERLTDMGAVGQGWDTVFRAAVG